MATETYMTVSELRLEDGTVIGDALTMRDDALAMR